MIIRLNRFLFLELIVYFAAFVYLLQISAFVDNLFFSTPYLKKNISKALPHASDVVHLCGMTHVKPNGNMIS